MAAKEAEGRHFKREPRRKAEFMKPLNTLKSKVGYGGLSADILTKAEQLLENSSVDFRPLAEMYLATLMRGVERASHPAAGDRSEMLIFGMLHPAMQLKANGGMFRYPLVTRIADKLVQFLEVIEATDKDAIEIVLAFHTTIRAVLMGRITGDGGRHGDELMQALEAACVHYLDHYPGKRAGTRQGRGEEGPGSGH
jgi:hypothetical protein